MEHRDSPIRYVVLLLFNLIPMILDILLYRMGATSQMLIWLPGLVCMLWLNYRNTGMIGLMLMQGYYALSRLASGYISTMLYTRNISDDGMSYAVGQLLTIVEILVILVVSAIAVIGKYVIARKKKGE